MRRTASSGRPPDDTHGAGGGGAMSHFMLWQRQQPVATGSDRRVFRASELPLLQDAESLRDALAEALATQGERESLAFAQARQAGHAEGLAAGHADAAQASARALLAVQARHAEALGELRSHLATLALNVVQRLIGDWPEPQRLAALAETAARDMVPCEDPVLRVRPELVTSVRAALEARTDGVPISVRGDADLPAGGCRLETTLGSVDASLDSQLVSLRALWLRPAQADEHTAPPGASPRSGRLADAGDSHGANHVTGR